MSSFSYLFGRHTVTELLDPEVEREAIESAREGDEYAFELLARQYAPALRRAVRDGGAWQDRGELEQAALLGFAEAIRDCEGDRLAGIIRQYITRAVAEVTGSYTALHIPQRTLSRFASLIRKAREELGEDANYDHVLDWAEGLAEHAGMAPETFAAVRLARYSDSYHLLEENGIEPSSWEDAAYAVCESDAKLCGIALEAISDHERTVVSRAYGFSTYDPEPDAQIAQLLGLSRPKVQRLRTGALAKMRDALGLAEAA